jgi:hypothetical protein
MRDDLDAFAGRMNALESVGRIPGGLAAQAGYARSKARELSCYLWARLARELAALAEVESKAGRPDRTGGESTLHASNDNEAVARDRCGEGLAGHFRPTWNFRVIQADA